MRISPRAVVSSVAACAIAIGWMGVTNATAAPTSEPPGARRIVVLRDGSDSDTVAKEHGRRYGAEVERVYHNALKGYVATFKGTGGDVAHDPRVAFVELDQKVSVQTTQPMTAGVAALYLSRMPSATRAAVRSALNARPEQKRRQVGRQGLADEPAADDVLIGGVVDGKPFGPA